MASRVKGLSELRLSVTAFLSYSLAPPSSLFKKMLNNWKDLQFIRCAEFELSSADGTLLVTSCRDTNLDNLYVILDLISQRGVTIRHYTSVAGSGHRFPPLSTVLRCFPVLVQLVMVTDLTLATLQTLAKEAPQTLQQLELYFDNRLTKHAEYIALLQRLLNEHQGIRYPLFR